MKVRKYSLWIASILSFLFFSLGILSIFLFDVKAEGVNNIDNNRPSSLFVQNKNLIFTDNYDSPDYVLQNYDIIKATYDAKENKEILVNALDYHKKGIKVDVLNSGTTIQFKNILSLDTLTKDTPIFDFVPLVKTRGMADMSKVTITLRDADDESNYINIIMEDVGHKQAGYTMVDYFVSTPEISARGFNYGKMNETAGEAGGLGYASSFTGINPMKVSSAFKNLYADIRNAIVYPFSFRFDKDTGFIFEQKTAQIGTNIAGRIDSYVLNIYDESKIGIGKSFKGFKNGRVKVSLTVDTLVSDSASLIIYNVFGMPLGDTTVEDEIGPNFLIDVPDDIAPMAEVEKPYRVFDCEAYDHISGICNYQVHLKTPNSENYELLEENQFIPKLPGEYLLKYTAQDLAGNVSERIYSINAKLQYDKLEIFAELDDLEYSVGEPVSIPQYSVTGGLGGINSGYEVIRSFDDLNVNITGANTFIPNLPGEYLIKYYAVDYVGNYADKIIRVNVISTNEPILNGRLNVQNKFIDGLTVKLPMVNVYDYYKSAGAALAAETDVTVYGNNGYSQVVSEDLLFIPDIEKFGENINIEYKFYCEGHVEKAIIQTYSAKIVNATQVSDYFSYNLDEFAVGYNLPENVNDTYVEFTAKQNKSSTLYFLNNLDASKFSVGFEIKAGKQNFEGLKIDLMDSDDATIGFSFTIRKLDDSMSYVDYNNLTYSMNGGFNNEESDKASVPFRLKYMNGALYDYNNKIIFEPTKAINGEVFDGFPSGSVKIYFTLLNPSSTAALTLTSINNDSLYASYDLNNNLVEFEDLIKPAISYDFDYSKSYVLGDKMILPYAIAYDTFTAYSEVRMTLYKPDGTYVYNNVLSEKGLVAIFDQNGEYILEYTTEDASGNRATAIEYISVLDDSEPPTITVESLQKMSYKIDTLVVLPEYYAMDNKTKEPTVYLFVLSPDGLYTQIDATKREYTPKFIGKHFVYYCAIDEMGYLTYEVLEFFIAGD